MRGTTVLWAECLLRGQDWRASRPVPPPNGGGFLAACPDQHTKAPRSIFLVGPEGFEPPTTEGKCTTVDIVGLSRDRLSLYVTIYVTGGNPTAVTPQTPLESILLERMELEDLS